MSENGENRLNITCFICQKGVENDNEPTVVFERGIEKLRNVSIERKDERHKIIADVNCTKVHIKCRKKYTDKSGGKFKYNYKYFKYNTLFLIQMLGNIVQPKRNCVDHLKEVLNFT